MWLFPHWAGPLRSTQSKELAGPTAEPSRLSPAWGTGFGALPPGVGVFQLDAADPGLCMEQEPDLLSHWVTDESWAEPEGDEECDRNTVSSK